MATDVRIRTWFAGVLALALLCVAPVVHAGDPASGQRIVEKWCSQCHAQTGAETNADRGPTYEQIASREGRDERYIRAFLDLDLPGIKRVVGDGPALAEMRKAYPDVDFAGTLTGEPLAEAYARSDVFVFPSRTDTYGIVLLEALASGLPVAAFPVPGPADVIGDSGVGVLDEDLGRAAREALSISRDGCRQFALGHGWRACALQFLGNVVTAQGLDCQVPALAAAAAP